MGPTNLALVKLFQADQALRAAQARLEAASRDVRVQQRRVDDLDERHRLAQARLKETRSQMAQVELDLKARDARIEKLRLQQQNARNNKEYQALLIEINTEKVDKGKVEDELIKLMEQVEKGQKELTELGAQLQAEKDRLTNMQQQIGDKLAALQAEVDALRAPRDQAHQAVPPKARDVFDRLSERFDGEALSAISKPDQRREEYVCSACNMDLVPDVYNKLHSRDELVFCPSCRRILYIPDNLPPEAAVHKKKPAKPRKAVKTSQTEPDRLPAAETTDPINPSTDLPPQGAPSVSSQQS